jgi:hypothetical protein
VSETSLSAIPNHIITTLTADEIQHLADRLFSRGISIISAYSRGEQKDLILASRAMRELLRRYERSAGRELHSLMLDAGGA